MYVVTGFIALRRVLDRRSAASKAESLCNPMYGLKAVPFKPLEARHDTTFADPLMKIDPAVWMIVLPVKPEVFQKI